MLGNVIRSVNQLRAILYDLRDMGLVSIRYMTQGKDHRIVQTIKLERQVEEEHISLLVDVDKIFVAKDGDERTEQGTSIYDRLKKR